jgi:hypothetical protein
MLASLFLLLAGCQLPPERLPPPLPEDGKAVVTYAELLTRARAQARVANESFYVDKWAELEDAARGLDQTARFLPKAEDTPPTHKQEIPRVSTELSADAGKLRLAAQNKDAKEVNVIMTRINRTVRDLRLDR